MNVTVLLRERMAVIYCAVGGDITHMWLDTWKDVSVNLCGAAMCAVDDVKV